MRTWLILFVLICFGCSTQRDVLNQKGKIHIIEKATIERIMPGDNVRLSYPKTPKDRPKDTTTVYTSKKGTKVNTTFDADGNVAEVDVNCPETREYEIRETEMTLEYKNKESQRKFNMEIARIISKTVTWAAVIFAIAWFAKGLLSKQS